MLIYEVNLSVDRSIALEYEDWLCGHIEEMLQFPGFVEARLFRREASDEGASIEDMLWTVHYVLTDRGSLDRYFREDAAAMRDEGLRKFGGLFKASRRILEEAALFHRGS
ncbi:MAG: DUF4286 family protein [Myxococcales bacterium]|nr:DUF4286 family protein [Myxococcales bacterium]MCB9644612.1 DUF4286 family protein [Myxococcales bacterium]